ncbi:tissue factor-like isoform X1 [Osmerus eperlanus]|uniref:tissue factor-like isoform X1 n=1 Tax=Osmerus eperlanus TaxID=29151 RepID=UPI002E1355BF
MELTKTFLCFFGMMCALTATGGAEAAERDHFPAASDLTWVSFNFKTILQWGPQPSNFSYTVEFSQLGENRKRNPHCIRTSDTECDLTNDLRLLRATYSADVLSEPLPGVTSDLVEFPFARAPQFNPYTDTLIGRPEFRVEWGEDRTRVRLLVSDPPTPLFREGVMQSIRDVFLKDLHYRVRYNKAGSTGKKEQTSRKSEVEVGGLDRGQSYCFRVAAYLPSRPAERRLGQWSRPQCSGGDRSIFQEFSTGVIVGAIFILLTFLILTLLLVGLCCRCCCRHGDKTSSKEDLAMTHV